MRAVRTDDVPAPDGLVLPLPAQDDRHGLGVLLERDQLHPALDSTAVPLEVLGQQALGDPLLDVERERVLRVELIKSLRAQLASLGHERPEDVEHLPLAEPSVDDPEPVKDLERTRLDSGRPRLSMRRRVALDETDEDARPGQQAAEHESGRAGTHDEHVGIGHRGRHGRVYRP